MRSTSSTASGSSADDVPRRFHRLAEGRELADAQHLARLDRMQRQFQRGGERQRALRSDQQPRQIVAPGGAGGRGQRVDVVAADAAKLLGEARGDLLGLGRAERRAGAGSDRRCWPASRRRDCPAPRRTGAACRRPGSRRSRGRCRPSARSGSISSRRSCCPPCRRWCSAHGSRDRPGRTVCAARNALFRCAQHQAGLDQRRARLRHRRAACGAGAWSNRSPARG